MKSWQVALRRWYAWRASAVACEPTFRTKPSEMAYDGIRELEISQIRDTIMLRPVCPS